MDSDDSRPIDNVDSDREEAPLVRPKFDSVGQSISGPIILGVAIMAVGQLIGIFGDVELLVMAGVVSLVGVLVVLLGVARLGDAVQYMAMRERDREHGIS